MMGIWTNLKAALNCGAGRKAIGIDIKKSKYEKARAYLVSSHI
ncbi:MAG: hypothetical protein WCA39_11890 [Nitrososphaeraceae archaeon]